MLQRPTVRCLLATALLGTLAGPAAAQSLEEALRLVYETNPRLQAQRDQLRATTEELEQARATMRPFLQGSADAGLQWNSVEPDSEFAQDSDFAEELTTPATLAFDVVQPLYRGGRTEADIQRAENLILSEEASLTATEQQVLLDASTAYLGVVLAQAVVDLAINNVEVLERQLQAARERFEVGEITRTSVAQAEARLAEAEATRIQAEGDLEAARANFVEVVGVAPTTLGPPPSVEMPGSLDEVVSLAETNNPAVIAAQYAQRSAEATVELVRGELRPEVSLNGRLSTRFEPSATIDRTDTAAVVAELTVPLYQGGAVSSRIRQAQAQAAQQQNQVDVNRRTVVEAAVTAWEGWETADAAIAARAQQVEAAEVALEGVEQEALVGARTVLDVLEAQQDVLEAQVALARAERDERVARFNVRAAAGLLTADSLGLAVASAGSAADLRGPEERWWDLSLPLD